MVGFICMSATPERSDPDHCGDATIASVGDGLRMDRIYRCQRHIYDLTRRYFLLGRLRLIDDLQPPAGGMMLEIACGTAWNLIQAARRYPDAHLYGFDISAAMLRTARSRIERAGLAQRIQLAAGDATSFDGAGMFGAARFDRIILSYTLSMVPAWELALQEAVCHLGPGGRLHIVDFGDCARWPKPLRRALRAWLAHFSVEPRADIRTRLAAIAERHDLHLDFRQIYGNYAVCAVLTRSQKCR
jgi:S-adenosylmethionine-diacylgycerolhomoserine-N-methlytransferase